MRVFISSVVRGLEPLRNVVAEAAQVLGHEVLRSEDIPAGPDPAERACLDLVRRSDAVVLLLGARYGASTGRGVAPTHQEYQEALDIGKDVLAFVQSDVDAESAQRSFIEEVRQWATGSAVRSFATPDELRNAVTRALKDLELSRVAGRVDPDEMAARAEGHVRAVEREIHEAALVIAVAPGPQQAIVRPQQMNDEAFQRELEKEALYGETAVLARGDAVRTSLERGILVARQDHARVVMDGDGSLVVLVAAMRREERGDRLPALIEEDIRDEVAKALRFIGRTLDRVDPGGRLTDVVVAAGLAKVGYTGWRTRAEHERDPHRLSMNVSAQEMVVVQLRPASRRRRALIAQSTELAEDLTILLRQETAR